MVITITLNPAMDKTLVLDGILVGEVNRAESARNDIGGKGINVSKVLKEMGTESMASGFLGGILEEVFRKELRKLGVSDSFVSVDGNTRTNIKIVDLKNATYTDINEPGPEISAGELSEFLSVYEGLMAQGDVVVLSGGIPQGVPVDIYGSLTRIARRKGAKVMVDAEGESLIHALKEIPDIIKPNEKELAGISGRDKLTQAEIIHEARKLIASGIGKVLVSRGDKGSILVTAEKVLVAEGLKVPVKSTVGAGDSMVAAMVHAMENHMNDLDMLALAQAAGAAAVMTEGTKACSLDEVNAHLDEAALNIREEE